MALFERIYESVDEDPDFEDSHYRYKRNQKVVTILDDMRIPNHDIAHGFGDINKPAIAIWKTGDIDDGAETLLHELGHTWGLNHVLKARAGCKPASSAYYFGFDINVWEYPTPEIHQFSDQYLGLNENDRKLPNRLGVEYDVGKMAIGYAVDDLMARGCGGAQTFSSLHMRIIAHRLGYVGERKDWKH